MKTLTLDTGEQLEIVDDISPRNREGRRVLFVVPIPPKEKSLLTEWHDYCDERSYSKDQALCALSRIVSRKLQELEGRIK